MRYIPEYISNGAKMRKQLYFIELFIIVETMARVV